MELKWSEVRLSKKAIVGAATPLWAASPISAWLAVSHLEGLQCNLSAHMDLELLQLSEIRGGASSSEWQIESEGEVKFNSPQGE